MGRMEKTMRAVRRRRFVFAGIGLAAILSGAALAKAETITVSGDTSAAINAAISSASSGDTVFIPAGTYDITASITPKSGVALSGDGSSQTILDYTGSSLNPIVNCNNSSNLAISNLTINGNNNADAEDGVLASNSSGLNISGVNFENFVSTSAFGPLGVYCSQDVTNSSIDNCSFSNIGTSAHYGGAIRFSDGSSNNSAIGNTIANTGRGGIFGDDGGGSNPSTNLTIENNTITGSGGVGLGIEVQDCPDALIQGNTVDHYISVDTSSGSAVRNNIISDTSGTYKFAGLELVNSQNVVFAGNTVNGGAQLGISESNGVAGQSSSYIYVANNTITNPSTWGIQVQGGTGGISDEYFYSNTFQTAQAANANSFAMPSGTGFRFNGNTQNIVLDSNTISGNAGDGIDVNGSGVDNLSFIDNTITNNGGSAVTMQGGANPSLVQWSGNSVSGNASNTGMTATVSSDDEPTISLNLLNTPVLGQPLDFSITLNSDSEHLDEVLWDFGDGLPYATNGFLASHEYDTPGTYEIGVVAWDTAGNAAHLQAELTFPINTPEPAALGVMAMGMLALRRRPRTARS